MGEAFETSKTFTSPSDGPGLEERGEMMLPLQQTQQESNSHTHSLGVYETTHMNKFHPVLRKALAETFKLGDGLPGITCAIVLRICCL